MAASPGHVALAVGKIGSYRRYFREAFGDDHLDAERVAEAIAAYEATRLSGNSTFDRFDAGDETALSAEQRLGRDLFFGRARCSACHLGFTFTDSRFHNLGVGYAAPPAGQDPRSGFRDLGRFEVTKEASDAGAFKTPTLRDCARRAPYMHDGSVPTLREAVLHHERGGIQNPWLDPEMKELNLSPKAVDALVAFLRALDGEGYEDSPPRSFPR
jgi:cytochrome c peroxidase